MPYLQWQDLDPIHLEGDLELRLRHVAGGSGYGQSTSSGSCAAAQLVQLPKESSLGMGKPRRSSGIFITFLISSSILILIHRIHSTNIHCTHASRILLKLQMPSRGRTTCAAKLCSCGQPGDRLLVEWSDGKKFP